MTLENLVGKSLEKIPVDASAILKLLQAAEQSLQDSKIETISNDSRFDLAYKAVMQLSNAALQANGYRTLTSKPGHHQTMIQSLPKTIGLDSDKVIQLDALRKARNVADYSGDPVTEKELETCLALADELCSEVNNWLNTNQVI